MNLHNYIVIGIVNEYYECIYDKKVFKRYHTKDWSMPRLKELMHDKYPCYTIFFLWDNKGLKDELAVYSDSKTAIKDATSLIRYRGKLTPEHFDSVNEQEININLKSSKMRQFAVRNFRERAQYKAEKGTDNVIGKVFGLAHFAVKSSEMILHHLGNGIAHSEGVVRHRIGIIKGSPETIASIRKERTDEYIEKATQIPKYVLDKSKVVVPKRFKLKTA